MIKKIQPQCSLIIDEASIREGMIYNHCQKCYIGFIDFGQGDSDGELPLATDVLVLFCVCLKEHSKYPVGYFFTRKTDCNMLAEIVKSGICKLHDVGMQVKAIVFDGLLTNTCMAEKFGAKLLHGEIILMFLNPADQEECYVIYDACHMIKLLRTALCDYKKFYLDDAHNPIDWTFIEKLYELQCSEEVHPGKKLTKKHIEWQRHKMNVKLAAQVFSNSVANALDYLREDSDKPGFEKSKETSDFIRLVNNTFDILNSRSKLGEGYAQPLSLKNIDVWKSTLDNFINVISNLKDKNGKLLQNGKRKTAFRGFIATAKSVQMLAFKLLSSESDLKYLTYRLSQDHLELFFNKIHQASGLNNNPNVVQFKNAYKKLLLKNYVPASSAGNCEIWVDEINSFLETSPDESYSSKISLEKDMLDIIESKDVNILQSNYRKNCLAYIAGYIVKKLNLKCLDCQNLLTAHESDFPDSEEIKLRKNYDKEGKMLLTIPSNSVCKIIKLSDIAFRSIKKMLHLKKIDSHVLNFVMSKIDHASLFCHAKQHFMEYLTHYPLLVKMIIDKFVKIRAHHFSELHHDIKSAGTSKRQLLSRQVIFLHQ